MPQSVEIVCTSRWDLPGLRRLLQRELLTAGASLGGRDDAVQVNGADGESWAILEDDHGLPAAEEFVANEDLESAFRAFAQGARVFTLMFRGLDLAHLVLEAISLCMRASGEAVWFDSEYGWVMTGGDYFWKVAQEPGWDWRTPTRPDFPR